MVYNNLAATLFQQDRLSESIKWSEWIIKMCETQQMYTLLYNKAKDRRNTAMELLEQQNIEVKEEIQLKHQMITPNHTTHLEINAISEVQTPPTIESEEEDVKRFLSLQDWHSLDGNQVCLQRVNDENMEIENNVIFFYS